MLSEKAKPIIQALFNKTYNEQALGEEPFGLSPESKVCSYTAGCAIGRFLPPSLTKRMGGSIESMLVWEGGGDVLYSRTRELLLGTPEVPEARSEDPDIRCLQNIQSAHDNCAHTTDRDSYRLYLINIARKYDLMVPDEEEHGSLPADRHAA